MREEWKRDSNQFWWFWWARQYPRQVYRFVKHNQYTQNVMSTETVIGINKKIRKCRDKSHNFYALALYTPLKISSIYFTITFPFHYSSCSFYLCTPHQNVFTFFLAILVVIVVVAVVVIVTLFISHSQSTYIHINSVIHNSQLILTFLKKR